MESQIVDVFKQTAKTVVISDNTTKKLNEIGREWKKSKKERARHVKGDHGKEKDRHTPLPSPCDIADFIRTGVIEREKAEEQNDKMEGKIAKLLAKYNIKLRRMKREAGKIYDPDERDDLEIRRRFFYHIGKSVVLKPRCALSPYESSVSATKPEAADERKHRTKAISKLYRMIMLSRNARQTFRKSQFEKRCDSKFAYTSSSIDGPYPIPWKLEINPAFQTAKTGDLQGFINYIDSGIKLNKEKPNDPTACNPSCVCKLMRIKWMNVNPLHIAITYNMDHFVLQALNPEYYKYEIRKERVAHYEVILKTWLCRPMGCFLPQVTEYAAMLGKFDLLPSLYEAMVRFHCKLPQIFSYEPRYHKFFDSCYRTAAYLGQIEGLSQVAKWQDKIQSSVTHCDVQAACYDAISRGNSQTLGKLLDLLVRKDVEEFLVIATGACKSPTSICRQNGICTMPLLHRAFLSQSTDIVRICLDAIYVAHVKLKQKNGKAISPFKWLDVDGMSPMACLVQTRNEKFIKRVFHMEASRYFLIQRKADSDMLQAAIVSGNFKTVCFLLPEVPLCAISEVCPLSTSISARSPHCLQLIGELYHLAFQTSLITDQFVFVHEKDIFEAVDTTLTSPFLKSIEMSIEKVSLHLEDELISFTLSHLFNEPVGQFRPLNLCHERVKEAMSQIFSLSQTPEMSQEEAAAVAAANQSHSYEM
ncbi:hypothetical protein WR25_14934 [Diploscapter pachys]|uniref:Uncharacterized protein n=1 Tax=Diploscapter pachys TaxID=2018661 RepID=A0A2A2LSH0_9BILA|nr:hypothetical protein WR25_14934 [Diploscapter pachys]